MENNESWHENWPIQNSMNNKGSQVFFGSMIIFEILQWIIITSIKTAWFEIFNWKFKWEDLMLRIFYITNSTEKWNFYNNEQCRKESNYARLMKTISFKGKEYFQNLTFKWNGTISDELLTSWKFYSLLFGILFSLVNKFMLIRIYSLFYYWWS